MTTTVTARIRRRAAVAVLTAAAVAVVTGCSTGSDAAETLRAGRASSSPSVPVSASGLPVVLRFGDHAIPATLADTAAATELAAMLPLRLTLSDAWRQAKSGQLPDPLRAQGTEGTLRPVPGGIYYWPDTAALAVYYDDLGQSVPPPGLTRLGAVDTGLDEIAGAGRQITVHIERVAGTGA